MWITSKGSTKTQFWSLIEERRQRKETGLWVSFLHWMEVVVLYLLSCELYMAFKILVTCPSLMFRWDEDLKTRVCVWETLEEGRKREESLRKNCWCMAHCCWQWCSPVWDYMRHDSTHFQCLGYGARNLRTSHYSTVIEGCSSWHPTLGLSSWDCFLMQGGRLLVSQLWIEMWQEPLKTSLLLETCLGC